MATTPVAVVDVTSLALSPLDIGLRMLLAMLVGAQLREALLQRPQHGGSASRLGAAPVEDDMEVDLLHPFRHFHQHQGIVRSGSIPTALPVCAPICWWPWGPAR